MSTDNQEDHRHKFDGFKAAWIISLRQYINSAQTMYAAGRIPMPHYMAVAMSMDRLVTAWNTTPYLANAIAALYTLPSVADILEATANGCYVTSAHNRETPPNAAHAPMPPSGPPSGPNILEWLENSKESPASGANTARELAAEAGVEAETSAKTQSVPTDGQ